MKITFNPVSAAEAEKTYTGKKEAAKAEKGLGAYGANFSVDKKESWSLEASSGKEKGKSLIELQQEAENVDVAVQQDYMTVMSHTMSQEDYARLSEEGFHFDQLDPEQAVTIVDKIKAELARSGQHIVGYTDDLNMDTLAAALGSDTLARTIADGFAQADIPMTEENIEGVSRAWDMASLLETPEEGTGYYMIDNDLEPEIWNLYLAQSSGTQGTGTNMPRYYAEEIQGYFTKSAEANTEEGLQSQIDKVIADAGQEVTEKSRQQARWLMQKGLPLTADNLKRLDELQELVFPVTEDAFAQAVTVAITEGKEPIHANLLHSENLYEKAARLAENYYPDRVAGLDETVITARRQLEEIRLRMTAEVNIKLLKSGFSIDTAPMEQLLDALKQAEKQIADTYFPEDRESVEKYELYTRTNQAVEELPQLPVQVIGVWSDRTQQDSIHAFHEEGKALARTLQNAGESYEALMTAPRSDLGDSIRKAFSNVDEILQDIGYEPTEENRRLVRILGYNRMDITVDNLEKVKAVDEQVRSVVERMTPAAVLKMIREGINPLEKSFEEVEKYFASLPEEYEESAESYSRFLYHLEQRKGINIDERQEYIDVFRLLRGIEKSDGAVIGAMVNSQMETNFKSLLAAVKSRRFRHMDVRVSEDEMIDRQYDRILLEQTRQASEADADSVALLQRGELPANAGNLLAARGILYDAAAPYRKWQEKTQQLEAQQTEAASFTEEDAAQQEELPKLLFRGNIWERLSDKPAFQNDYREMLSDLSKQVENASLNLAQTSLDVREMQMIHKQLSVAASLADAEEYVLPMYIGEALAKVHLTLEHGKSRRGEVSVKVDISQEMQLEAHFTLKNDKLQGILVGNTQEEVTKLQKAADIFLELSQQNGNLDWKIEELPIVIAGTGRNVAGTGSDWKVLGIGKDGTGRTPDEAGAEEVSGQPDNTVLYRVAKLFLQAIR